jgi:hypothetical protein
MVKTINVMLRSETFGAGKTWTALSFVNPSRQPKRLVYDGEFRADSYRSNDGLDHLDRGMFAFDFWYEVYGEEFVKAFLKVIAEVLAGTFPYNVLVIDNATIMQDELDIAMRSKVVAQQLTDALGITAKHLNFLQYRFNPNDVGGYYYVVKAVIRAFLMLLRRNEIDVIVTSESKNVWQNYGSRDKENPAKIMGQTAKLWEPWFQMGDILLNLERMTGSRLNGTAKLTQYPTARLDTFNPKCSIPGIAPEFVFSDWNVFWRMALRRVMPDGEAFAALEIPIAVTPENAGLETIAEAKQAIVEHALKVGFIANIGEARTKIVELGKLKKLDPSNSLAEYWDWIAAIDEAVTCGS